MKTNKIYGLALGAMLLMSGTTAWAQEMTEEETKKCNESITLYQQALNITKSMEDAFSNWMDAYTNCPGYKECIYQEGPKVIAWKISQYKPGTAEYNEWREFLMKVYDERIELFGKRTFVLGQKGKDYCTYYAEEVNKENAYAWLKESVTALKAKSQMMVVSSLANVSFELYKNNPEKNAEQYIADYQLCSDIFTEMLAGKNAKAAAAMKESLDNAFARSGAADCAKMDEIFASKVQANLENLDELDKVINLYDRVNCTESEVYFAASEASHKLNPTAASAAGCAKMCVKKEDWKGAIAYFDQAVDLAESDDKKADYLYNAAAILYGKLDSKSQARQYLRRSLEFNPNQGRCYILIGIMYANSQPYSKDEYGAKASILNKTVYWVAVDKFQKAKQVDESSAAEANKMIQTYSKYFPTKEERFDLPNEFSGSTFTVGGWIGESTTIR